MRKKELKIKAKVSSKAKFSKKLQRKDNKANGVNSAAKKKSKPNEEVYRPSWAVDDNDNIQDQNGDVDVEDIMDMVDKEDREDLISGYLESIEKQYETKAARAEEKLVPEEEEDYEEDEEDEEADQRDNTNIAKSKTNYSELASMSSIDSLLIIRKLKAQLQEEIAIASDAIMSHPEANIYRMKKLFILLDTSASSDEYGLIFFNVQQTVTESLCVIFNDIIPNYRLAERFNVQDLDAGDKKQHLKRDTMKTYIYEKSVLQFYKLYLQRLQRMINAELDPAGRKSNFYQQMLTTGKARYKLASVACHCLSEMLSHHYNFNYRSDVISSLAKVLCNTNRVDDSMRDICTRAFSRLFRDDTLGEASLEAVNEISELVIKQNYRVSPQVFKTFLNLNLRELANENAQLNGLGKGNASVKKDRKTMSRKERKRAKHFSKMEKELLEAEATESKEKRYSFRVDIHKKIFALYFRFVKHCLDINHLPSESEERDFNIWYRPLFPPLFQGMAQYSVYLNDVYIYELVNLLLKLVKGDQVKGQPDNCQMSSTERLCCLKTISQILTLTGNLLTIDFQVPYLVLYELCTDPTVIYESMQMLLECIEEMVIKRFKQLSLNRITSFIQRLILLSLYLSGSEAIAFLTVIKRLFQQHQGAAEAIFDCEDSEQSLDSRLPEISQGTNLLSTREANPLMILYKLVHQHSDPYVRFVAHALLVHFSDPQGRTTNIAENRLVAKKMKDTNLVPDLCQELLRSPNPARVYNLLNVATVNLELIFHKSPNFAHKQSKGKAKSR